MTQEVEKLSQVSKRVSKRKGSVTQKNGVKGNPKGFPKPIRVESSSRGE